MKDNVKKSLTLVSAQVPKVWFHVGVQLYKSSKLSLWNDHILDKSSGFGLLLSDQQRFNTEACDHFRC